MKVDAHTHTHTPVRPHQVGQREVSLTTPDANMSLKRSQRSSQKVTRSCCRSPLGPPRTRHSGATRTHRNPVSSSRLSLGRESGA